MHWLIYFGIVLSRIESMFTRNMHVPPGNEINVVIGELLKFSVIQKHCLGMNSYDFTYKA